MAVTNNGLSQELKDEIIESAVDVIVAFVSNKKINVDDLPALISSVRAAFNNIGSQEHDSIKEDLVPAVSIKKSVKDNYIICLEDGLKFKSLKRHLASKYKLTPEAYRKKWGLPPGYPMVAPSYSRERSAIALKNRLGQVIPSEANAKPKKVDQKRLQTNNPSRKSSRPKTTSR